MQTHTNTKTDLIQTYHWLRQYGYNDSHSGNISIRDGDTIWVTPTGACADTLTEEDLIACPLEGDPGKGASLDAPLHMQCYRENPKLGAVIHSHGPYSVGITMDLSDYTPADFEGQYYFPNVPILRIDYDTYVDEAPAQVAAALKNNKLVIVAGHGVYAAAENLNLAYKWTCSLELSAKTDLIHRLARTNATQ
jgi:L-fuculose-phosphate aldolase